ncbi:MAG: hypothetical protein IJ479_00975 [Alphaproteobacteria bacterium]|nr:hypothetical protein [Alphaproteobacteria bacterium]
MSFECFSEKRQKRIKLLEAKYKICTNPVLKDGYLRQMNYLSEELSFARPDTPADTEERKRILGTYADTIRNTVTDEHPLWFHGVRHIASLEKILNSGHLGYLEEEESRSLTSPGTVDVTSKYSVDTTIKGFCGLSSNYLPAGCIFVLTPKDADERRLTQDSGSEQNIKTVDFAENPDRLYAIVSTTENLDYITGLAGKYGLSKEKIHSFDSFIEKYKEDFRQDKHMDMQLIKQHTAQRSL